MIREAALAVSLLAASATVAGDLVVTAGSAFDGERFLEGPVTLHVRDGRLAGTSPDGAGRLGHAGLIVLPGLVDLRAAGLLALASANEEREELTPAWRALDAVEGHSPAMTAALRSGVTTVVASPHARNVVGGLAAAVKTDDRPLAQRVVNDEVAVLLALGLEPALGNRSARFQAPWGLHFRRPGNRMGVLADIRRAAAIGRGGAHGEDAAVLARVLSGALPAWTVARTDGDVRTALRLCREMGLRPVLLEAFEAHRQASALKDAGATVVLGPEYQLPRHLMERLEGQDTRAATASILHAAGVTVALASGLADAPGTLRDRAILARRHGLPPQAALAAVTSVPAQLIGRAGRLGTLRPGADADLVLIDGDPLSPASRVVAVVIDGRVAWRDPSLPEETSP